MGPATRRSILPVSRTFLLESDGSANPPGPPSAHSVCTSGTSISMRVPRPGWLSTHIRYSLPNRTLSRSLTLLTPIPPCSSSVPRRSSGMPTPSSSTETCSFEPRRSRADADGAPFHLAAQAVLDAVFHQRLQHHAGHQHIQRVRGDVRFEAQLVAEADHLDGEVVLDEAQLVAQRAEVLVLAQQARAAPWRASPP